VKHREQTIVAGVFSRAYTQMTTPTKRLVWALALVTSLFAVIVVAVVYLYGLPPVIASLLNRTVREPGSEDYAVYSAFVDGFFSSNSPSRGGESIGQDGVAYVASETRQMKNPGSILPLDVAALGPSDMGEDFFRQNAQTWHLQPRFHTRSRVLLVGGQTVSGVLRLSRIGLNRRGTLALLHYSYRCGELCSRSGWVVLHRTEGHWRIEQFGSGVIY
jgi:hypothetical protein